MEQALPVPSGLEGDAGGTEEAMLSGVLALLDRHAIPYCVPHGYAGLPARIGSDVDLILSPRCSAKALATLLSTEARSFGARLVRWRGSHFMLTSRRGDGSHAFLTIDVDYASQFGGLTFFSATEMLTERKRHRSFRVPSTGMEFGHLLARAVMREQLNKHKEHLQSLFRQDATSCREVLAALLSADDCALILAAANTGNWRQVEMNWSGLRKRLMRRSVMKHPLPRLQSGYEWLASRIARLLRPDGAAIVVLGPDGAGKSSSTDALAGPALLPAFDRSVCQGFVPPLHRLLGKNHGPSSEPHAMPPRPLLHSLARCAYWLAYSVADQARVHVTKARGGLVLYDRHLVDIMVDQKRYRYSGPLWPIHLICKLAPKPDLVFVLDAPAEIIQSRKQEVPFEETDRQRRAYLHVVEQLGNGHAINGGSPFDRVLADINEVVLRLLEARVEERVGRRGGNGGVSFRQDAL